MSAGMELKHLEAAARVCAVDERNIEMNAQSKNVEQFPTKSEQAVHENLYAALAAAQSEMGKALKDSENPHFKSKYADLSSVVNACFPALTRNGIAVLQPPYDDETGRYVKTILVHGKSGETSECRVPLIIGKNDMQGYGSAVTYARRYGLMAMAGIAPDDDDGNAAVAAAPKPPSAAEMKRQLDVLKNDLVDAGTEVSLTSLWKQWAKIMNDQNWPQEENEQSYRAVVKEMFRTRKVEISEAAEAEQDALEAAKVVTA